MTLTYKEWIKFGRDPVYPKDFYALSKKEAREFFRGLMGAIPERMGQLRALIHWCRPECTWCADYSDAAFEMLLDTVTKSVERVPRTPAEIEEIRGGRSEIMNTINEPIWQWRVSDRTISIAYDAAIYFGNDLISKESRMIWQLDERKVMSNHQPIVRAPNPSREPPYLESAPLDLFRLYVFRVANNDPHVYTMVETRQFWLEAIGDYKRNNPE